MTFQEYIDDLCKQGIIDGNIAERICGLHSEESSNPSAANSKKILPVLNDMWSWPITPGDINSTAIHTFADKIDDIISS